jgi:hypothetical protein
VNRFSIAIASTMFLYQLASSARISVQTGGLINKLLRNLLYDTEYVLHCTLADVSGTKCNVSKSLSSVLDLCVFSMAAG